MKVDNLVLSDLLGGSVWRNSEKEENTHANRKMVCYQLCWKVKFF